MSQSALIEQQRAALVAAQQLIEGSAELLAFHREGYAGGTYPFETELVSNLTEALAAVATIELASLVSDTESEQREMLGQLIAACRRYIEA